MYYTKTKINKDTTFRTKITDENVFTRCCRCGDEIQVDLNEAVDDGKLDLFGTSWYCLKCTEHVKKGREA